MGGLVQYIRHIPTAMGDPVHPLSAPFAYLRLFSTLVIRSLPPLLVFACFRPHPSVLFPFRLLVACYRPIHLLSAPLLAFDPIHMFSHPLLVCCSFSTPLFRSLSPSFVCCSLSTPFICSLPPLLVVARFRSFSILFIRSLSPSLVYSRTSLMFV